MKLLVDNQLPRALADHVRGWGFHCAHVLERGLSKADDLTIWGIAATEGRIVVSKDEDFVYLANRPGDAGRLVWVRLGNCRNPALLAAFDAARPGIEAAITSGQRIVEVR